MTADFRINSPRPSTHDDHNTGPDLTSSLDLTTPHRMVVTVSPCGRADLVSTLDPQDTLRVLRGLADRVERDGTRATTFHL